MVNYWGSKYQIFCLSLLINKNPFFIQLFFLCSSALSKCFQNIVKQVKVKLTMALVTMSTSSFCLAIEKCYKCNQYRIASHLAPNNSRSFKIINLTRALCDKKRINHCCLSIKSKLINHGLLLINFLCFSFRLFFFLHFVLLLSLVLINKI